MEVQPEAQLGFIRVKGEGEVKFIFVVPTGSSKNALGHYAVQQAKKFNTVMAVPLGTYDIWVDDSLLEGGFEVQAGQLYEFE
jgi:hypothetical protein